MVVTQGLDDVGFIFDDNNLFTLDIQVFGAPGPILSKNIVLG